MRALAVVSIFVLAGCSAPSVQDFGLPPAAPPKAAPASLAPLCLAVKPYATADGKALAAAIAALPPNSPIIPAISDYAMMRKEASACAAAAK